MSAPSLDTTLIRWRNNLIDLTRRNPLLALRPTRSSFLEIKAPDLAAIFDYLVPKNKTFTFWLPPLPKATEPQRSGPALQSRPDGSGEPSYKKEPDSKEKLTAPKPTELVTGEPDRGRLLQILTNLYRRYLTDFRERGLHILYLAAGVLAWRDPDEEPMRSPLILVPVVLKRKSLQEPFLLDALEEEPFLNPALCARLKQDFDFALPAPPEDWNVEALTAYLAKVTTAIEGLPGWHVEPAALLALFSFFKGVIFQDLQDNEARLKEHAIVKALAGAPMSFKKTTLPTERELDDQQDPAQTYHILDADGSQRLCLEAAARGDTFALIGPPGTGKSQTIANLIAEQIAHGNRVLFVSEKMAALDVVYQRLRRVGLDDFCLELHSAKASKRAVVAEFARCLAERQKSPESGSADGATDVIKLKERRDRLNQYVRALHRQREPMRRSAWEALADLPRWTNLAAIPLGLPLIRQEGVSGTLVTDITPSQLDDLQKMLARLQQLWHVRAEAGYPWLGFKADRFTLQLRDEVVGLIDKVRARLDKLKAIAEQYAAKIGVTGETGWLLKLGDILDNRPGVLPSAWLRESALDRLSEEVEQCAGQYQRLGQARLPLTQKYGNDVWTLPPGTAAKVDEAWKNADKLLANDDDRGKNLLAAQQKLRAWAADTLKKLPTWVTEARTLEKWLALPLPLGAGAETGSKTGGDSRLDPSPHGIRQLLRLATLCMADHAPERPWVHEAPALQSAQELVAANRSVFAAHRERRARLLQIYNETFFELELDRIARGFAGPYQSWFRLFNGQYRRDRRALKRRTHKDHVPATVAEDVALGRDLVAEQTRLDGESSRRQGILGRYEKGMHTDWEAVHHATEVAGEALQLAHQLGNSHLPARLMDALCATTPPAEKIRSAYKRLSDSVGYWQKETQDLKNLLPMELPGQGGESMDDCALSAIQYFAKDLQAALNNLGGLTNLVLGHASEPPEDLATLSADLHQAEDLLAKEASQETEAARWRERFGSQFQGMGTNWDMLRKGLAWTKRLRESFQTEPGENKILPAPTETIIALAAGADAMPSTQELRHAQEQYEQALHNLEIRFDTPGPKLAGGRFLEQPHDLVHQHLGRLRERVGELSDWIDYRHLPDRFAHLGLRKFWDQLQEEPPPPEHVVDVFLKSFWSSWIEAIFQQDAVLSAFRRADHERLLAEFHDLDKEWINRGADRVAKQALRQSLPTSFEEDCALLSKEAHKKTKHLPLRRLFEAIPGLVAHLKPCLLMSPLSVSQFLPSQPGIMDFDLVVFDEASQILPEDALGAIYRGKQVVITGDNQQLPPTTFFQQIASDDGEESAEEETPLFESILDAGLGAGMPRQLLRWHYRSRHEHLIAYSNDKFYEGRLVTFPSAWRDHPGLGVRFRHVPDGVYDRGGRRDNPREAQVVADLAFEHYRQHPDQTLGVIAFSYAQMNAVEDEIDRRLHTEPDMERFFQGDRLEGFFVKNLETVQGDERDVILLSVGYGKDSQGQMALNFGPLNRDGGPRRLNVAITRARRQLILVSSMHAADIPATASGPVQHLRQYLDFAQRGITALRPINGDAGAAQEATGLEAAVQEELARLGYECVARVGCGAYRIDLGVVDPKNPGCFLLAIEFDGPSYNQTGTARDRDRLRPDILQQLGWKLHRIWSPDWIYRRDEEIERLRLTLTGAT